MRRKKDIAIQKAFTLVEIMIVVSAIVLLAAVSIPLVLRARISANESAAISNMRTIFSAAQSFRASNPYYPQYLMTLGPNPNGPLGYCSAQVGYLENKLGCANLYTGCKKQGYRYFLQGPDPLNIPPGNPNAFEVTARPMSYRITGERNFYLDESGILRWAKSPTSAGKSSPPVE